MRSPPTPLGFCRNFPTYRSTVRGGNSKRLPGAVPLCHICISIQLHCLTMKQMGLPYLYNSGQQRFLSHTKERA